MCVCVCVCGEGGGGGDTFHRLAILLILRALLAVRSSLYSAPPHDQLIITQSPNNLEIPVQHNALVVQHKGGGGSGWRTVRTAMPLKMEDKAYFYLLRVESLGAAGHYQRMMIGFCIPSTDPVKVHSTTAQAVVCVGSHLTRFSLSSGSLGCGCVMLCCVVLTGRVQWPMSEIGCRRGGWSYIAQTGDCLNWSAEVTGYGEPYSDGDLIGCLLDTRRHEIEFYRNGVSQGIVKCAGDRYLPNGSSVTAIVYGAVSLSGQGAKVRLITPVPGFALTAPLCAVCHMLCARLLTVCCACVFRAVCCGGAAV